MMLNFLGYTHYGDDSLVKSSELQISTVPVAIAAVTG